MSGRKRTVVSLLGSIVGLSLALPALASGATVSVVGAQLIYTAAAGETNTPLFSYAQGPPGQYTVTGDAAPLAAGAGCIVVVGGIQCEDTGIFQINATFDNLDDQGGSLAPSIPVRIIVNAGDGNDSFTGGIGSDTFAGGIGNDTFNGGDAGDGMVGDAGADVLNGNGGPDQLTGGADGDNISGGDGDDRIQGGFGNDIQNGGPGNDQFGQGGDDTGADTYNGGSGVDGVFFTNAGGPVNVTLDDVINDGPQGTDSVPSDIENAFGSQFADMITGSNGPNVLEGQAGADVINGLGGNDQVMGHSFIPSGDGNNILSGGDGDDLLMDGGGDETLSGGNGNDELAAGPGADDMLGGAGVDTVAWGGNFPTYPSSIDVLNGLVVTLDDVPDDGYVNEGDNAHSDNENIVGFAFSDILRGNASRNVIDGSGGNDLIDLSGPGPDSAICGLGSETVIADPDDSYTRDGDTFCDNVSLTGPRSVFLAVFASSKAKKGVAKVSVTCLPQAMDLCDGSVRLLKGGTTIGREEFELLPGEATVLGVELSDSARQQLNKGKKLKVELRAVGTDNTGIQELDTALATLKGKKKGK